MEREKIIDLVGQMTLEEKAALTSGKDAWFTKAVERLQIPSVRTSDGPHGLRKLDVDDMSVMEGHSVPAVCFPAGCAAAASFDRDLLHRMGEALGKECQAMYVDVLLGPGINIKRSPLCGRNFEYFSEDPFLAGELGAAYVNGVQSQGIGTSLKHFFANSQEYRRMDSSSEMDERTMREIYLTAFEMVVKKAQPWTVMASYNKIDSVYATANKKYLTGVLRDEWGFEGLVMSDWGATHDRAAAVTAGCDLTMPAEDTDILIVEAVNDGRLSESDLDFCCVRILDLVFKVTEGKKNGAKLDYEGDHELSHEIASQSMVLLKNDGILPVNKSDSIAFIGAFAKNPRIQGGGSSHINCSKITGALSAAQSKSLLVSYTAGYKADGSTDDTLLNEAIAAAKDAQIAVLFVGLPDNMESEGVDRIHMRLPDGHNALVEAVCAAQPNTVVVLHNGSPVEMPWVNSPKAILEAYLGGQAVGEATVDILFGDVNPSGHLAETFPIKLEDNPSYLSYFGEGNKVSYSEGIFVGYRYYESKKMEVLFPFGHGLSYTTFEYSDLQLDKDSMSERETLHVTLSVTNTGNRAGKAVVQLYIAPEKVDIIRPVRELKDFAKVKLSPGETKTIKFALDIRAFAHWNSTVHAWRCESGKYTVEIGENAHTTALSADIQLDAELLPPSGGYCLGMPMSVLAKVPDGRKFLDESVIYMVKGMVVAGYIPQTMMSFADNIPGGLTLDAIEQIAQKAGALGGNAGGVSGLNALLSQSVSILATFLSKEKKNELDALLDKLNKELTVDYEKSEEEHNENSMSED